MPFPAGGNHHDRHRPGREEFFHEDDMDEYFKDYYDDKDDDDYDGFNDHKRKDFHMKCLCDEGHTGRRCQSKCSS